MVGVDTAVVSETAGELVSWTAKVNACVAELPATSSTLAVTVIVPSDTPIFEPTAQVKALEAAVQVTALPP